MKTSLHFNCHNKCFDLVNFEKKKNYVELFMRISGGQTHAIIKQKESHGGFVGTLWGFIKSTKYKKLAPNALRFTSWNLKSCKSHEKNVTKNIRLLVFSFSSINLAFLMFFVLFFYVVCKISNYNKYVNRKASFLYWVDFTKIDLIESHGGLPGGFLGASSRTLIKGHTL